jgi:hypothetical protein
VTLNGHYTASGKKTATVLHVLDTSTHDSARATALGAAVQGWLASGDKAMFHGHFQWDSINILDLETSTGISVVYATGFPVTGTAGGDPAGGQVCAITTLTTGQRGRSYRGRVYWPAVSNSFINSADGCTIDSDELANYDALITHLQTALGGLSGSVNLAVASKKLLAAHAVTAHQTRTWIGTQRRRVAP